LREKKSPHSLCVRSRRLVSRNLDLDEYQDQDDTIQAAFFHILLDLLYVNHSMDGFKDGFDKEKLATYERKHNDNEQGKIANWLAYITTHPQQPGPPDPTAFVETPVPEKDNIYVSKDELLAMGFKHLLRQTDEKIASKEAGLDLRPVTTSEIQAHLDDFGLAQEFGTYGKIRGLSGGQKVKLVLAAAMWNCPHLLVLDGECTCILETLPHLILFTIDFLCFTPIPSFPLIIYHLYNLPPKFPFQNPPTISTARHLGHYPPP